MTLLYLAVAYMLGIGLGKWIWDYGLLGCDLPAWLWWIPLCLLLFVPRLHRWEREQEIARHRPLRWPASAGFVPPAPPLSLALCISLLLCLLLGSLRYAAQPLTPCWTSADLAYYNLPTSHAFDRQAVQLTMEGSIHTYPTQEDGRNQLYVAIEKVMIDDVAHPVQGVLFLQSNNNDKRRYVYGQFIRLSGRLTTPSDFEDFSYREYLARRGIHSILYDAQIEPLARPLRGWRHYLYALRARGEMLINQSLPEPYAALANGILLGIDSGIPDELYNQFSFVGISHLLVISGSNVALIAAIALALSQRIVGAKRAVYPTLLVIASYALLVGGDAAVLRAAVMGGLVVLAAALQRRNTALISLAAACAAMTLLNPLTLWDIGFQLSSMATAGLVLFTPPLAAFFAKMIPGFEGSPLTFTPTLHQEPETPATHRAAGSIFYSLIADSLIVTLAASVMVQPLLIFYFGRLSLISIVANLLVAAVQPLILLSGTVGLLAGVVGLAVVTKIFLWVAWFGLYWTTLVAQWAAQLPGANLEIARYGWSELVITYALVFAFYLWNPRLLNIYQKHQKQTWRIDMTLIDNLQPLLLGGLMLMATLVWATVATLPDGRLHVYFLTIDGGTGMLIQTPAGRQILIDGGPIPQRLVSELGGVMPFWDRSLDLVVLTQPDSDAMHTLAQLPRHFQVAHALEPVSDPVQPNEQWDARREEVASAQTTMHVGSWVDLGDGVTLRVLEPPSQPAPAQNSTSVEPLVLELVYNDFRALLSGKGEPVAASVNPQVTMIQDGAVLTTHTTMPMNRNVWRTEQAGRVHLYTNGQEVWVEAERNLWWLGN